MQGQTRRDLLKMTSVAAGVAMAGLQVSAAPRGEIEVRVTAADKRYAQQASLQWHGAAGRPGTQAIVVDPGKSFQQILGFGAALTDSTCYILSQMPEGARGELLQEMFDPSKMGLQVCRICIGSSDYARTAYSFDEGESDPEMKRFSIEHDEEYILPTLRAIRKINPELFLLATPWSPPGWMKPNGSMLGGCMRRTSFPAYAKYFTRFLEEYAKAGVPVQAVSVQNEVDAEQGGRMPACLFAQEHETEFVADHLGPALEKSGIQTKVWILDHNYNLWGRVMDELADPRVRKVVDGVAWHGYLGEPAAMSKVHEAYPDKHMYWTEGGPDYTDPKYATEWAHWGSTFAGILQNWGRCAIAWNLALDEVGKPNIGPFTCGGVVTVHSKTQEVARSGQYWAFAHYAQAFRPGATRVHSSGSVEKMSHVAARNVDGSLALVMTNEGAARTLRVRVPGSEVEVALPEDSLVNLSWRG